MSKKITRKEFLARGIKTILATAVITACGNLIAFGSNDKEEIKEVSVGEDGFIIALEDLSENQAINFVYKGKKSILLYNHGKIKAFENICTHKGGPSKLVKDTLVCQWHGATFDPMTGKALTGPAPLGSRLTAVALRKQDAKIYMDLS